jgi:hypothetical protein
MLSAKLDAGQAPIPKQLPNLALGPAVIASQFAGSSGRIFVLPQAPSPSLSPKGERNMKEAWRFCEAFPP